MNENLDLLLEILNFTLISILLLLINLAALWSIAQSAIFGNKLIIRSLKLYKKAILVNNLQF